MAQTTLAQGVTMTVNILTGVITARLLGPVGRGEFAAASIWLLLPSLLALAGLQNGVIYETRRETDDSSDIAILACAIATAIFVPIMLASDALMPWMMHAYSPGVVGLARFAIASSALNIWFGIYRQSLLGVHQVAKANLLVCGVAFTYLALLLLLTLFHAVSPATAVCAQIGSTAIWLIASLPKPWRHSFHASFRRMAAHFGPLLRYSIRAAPIDLVTTLSQNVDRIVLITLIPAADFGLYVVAASFARILSMVQAGISGVMLSDLADRTDADVATFTQRCFRIIIACFAVLACVIFQVDGMLLRTVYGSGFAAAVPVFRLLLLDAALSCLGQVLIQAFLSRNASSSASGIQVACLIISALMIVVLAPVWGGVGAAAALAAGSAIRLALLLRALQRIGIAPPGVILHRSDLDALLRHVRPL